MGYYKNAEICLNGHLISANASSDNHQKFCTQCGVQTISKCIKCDEPIRGWYQPDGIAVIHNSKNFKIPSYCHSCGDPYPWTSSAIETAELLIREEEEISQEEIDKLVEVLSDLTVETPKTKLAIVRIKKFLSKSTEFTADGLKQFLIEFGCELALKSLNMK